VIIDVWLARAGGAVFTPAFGAIPPRFNIACNAAFVRRDLRAQF